MINEKNFFSESKKINVSNTSSLVNLKAELFKKKQDAIKGRSSNTTDEFEKVNTKNVLNSKWNQKAIQLDQKIRDSIRTRKVPQSVSAEEAYLERELKRSKESLERKTKIYEEKLRSAYDSLTKNDEKTDETDDNLIDFERKILDASKDGIKLFDNIETSSTQLTDPEGMVEYQDSFGRTRYCKRRELDKIEKVNEQELLRRKLDRDLTRDEVRPAGSNEMSRSDLYPDLYSNFVKPTDQAEEKTDESHTSHYQTVSKDEIREHGTSYYQFSLDEEKRKEQMQELDKLRNQTVEQRKKADQKLEKRNLAIKQRLLKLAKRKGLVDEEDLFDEKEVSERMKLDQYMKSVPSSINADDLNDKECSIELKERKLREWDKNKFDKLDFYIDRKGSAAICDPKMEDSESSDESRVEFAPPDFYETKTNRRKKFKCESGTDQTVDDKIDEFLNRFK